MSNATNSSSGGIGFSGMLTILFVGLKLTGYIDWSWWWIFSPLWISAGLAFFIFAIVFGTLLISETLHGKGHGGTARWTHQDMD